VHPPVLRAVKPSKLKLGWSFSEGHNISMNAVLSPIVSEFKTEEEAKSYDLWFRTKVEQALNDPRPSMPHDEAMTRVDRLLDERRQSRAVS